MWKCAIKIKIFICFTSVLIHQLLFVSVLFFFLYFVAFVAVFWLSNTVFFFLAANGKTFTGKLCFSVFYFFHYFSKLILRRVYTGRDDVGNDDDGDGGDSIDGDNVDFTSIILQHPLSSTPSLSHPTP